MVLLVAVVAAAVVVAGNDLTTTVGVFAFFGLLRLIMRSVPRTATNGARRERRWGGRQ